MKKMRGLHSVPFALFLTILSFMTGSHIVQAADKSQAMAQFAPSNMEAGKKYSVMLQFKNTGNTTWTSSSHMLGSKNPSNNQFWGTKRIKIASGDAIRPGGTLTAKFSVTAPSKPGTYNFQWQMMRTGGSWFGQKSPNIVIPVEGKGDKNNSDFVLQELPGLVQVGPPYTVLNVGQNFTVKLIFKNTGSSTWTWGRIKIGSQKPANNLTWLIDQISLNTKEKVKPGEFKTFTFNAVVPTKPGIYDFQWQMFEEGVGWFGNKSPNVKITVLK